MAENIIDIPGASQDFQTIEDFVNLPADSEVYPRLLPSVNVGTLAGARQAIFEAGGLPAKPFETKALMTASTLVDGDYAIVTNDAITDNNGLYLKSNGAFAKTPYSIDTIVGNKLSGIVSDEPKKNLYDPSKRINNKYISTNGTITTGSGWSTSDYIPVIAGKKYAVSSSNRRVGLAFFSDKTSSYIAGTYNESRNVVLTAPTGANYLVINTDNPTTVSSNVQVEQNSMITAYEPYQIVSRFNTNALPSDLVYKSDLQTESNAQLVITNDYRSRIMSQNEINVDLEIEHNPLVTNNDKAQVFNFRIDNIDSSVIRVTTDDVAPLRIDNATVGANHGYFRTEVTRVGHGKTNADVGSVWSDGALEFVLIDVLTADKLSVTSRVGNVALTANILTHVSGATNTAALNTSTKTTLQWYPAIKNRQLNCYVDDKKINISQAKTHDYAKSVVWHESYEIMAKTDIVEWIIANGGIKLSSYDAPGSVLFNNSYSFDVDAACTIYTSITALKTIPFSDYMATQSVPFADSTRFYYVPKTTPFEQQSVSYNFTQLQPMASLAGTSIFFDNSKLESGANPVDRLLQFNSSIGYATGFLPVLAAKPSDRLVNASNKYLEIRGGGKLKIYPALVDSAAKSTLNVGDSYAGIAYRKYFKRSSKRTAKYVIRSNVADFLYLDWHSAKTDIIELDDDLIGREFSVHEKSSNVTLLSAFATNNIAVKVDSSKSYGYLVLRFDK